MTKERFEQAVEDLGFDEAMCLLWNQKDCITHYDSLKGFAQQKLDKDNVGLALHILNAIYNSDGNSDWYYYDYCAGTTCTPRCLNTIDDVENYIGFDKEIK